MSAARTKAKTGKSPAKKKAAKKAATKKKVKKVTAKKTGTKKASSKKATAKTTNAKKTTKRKTKATPSTGKAAAEKTCETTAVNAAEAILDTIDAPLVDVDATRAAPTPGAPPPDWEEADQAWLQSADTSVAPQQETPDLTVIEVATPSLASLTLRQVLGSLVVATPQPTGYRRIAAWVIGAFVLGAVSSAIFLPS